jgi:hypothetical protein
MQNNSSAMDKNHDGRPIKVYVTSSENRKYGGYTTYVLIYLFFYSFDTTNHFRWSTLHTSTLQCKELYIIKHQNKVTLKV